MISNVIFNSIVLKYIFLPLVFTFKYDMLFRDEEIFSPCEIPNVKFIDEYLDLTNLHFENLSNGSVYVNGEAIVLKDIKGQNNKFSIEYYKRSRSNWVNTIYSIRRQDFCTTMFDPTEFWYPFTKDIQDKTCPFYKGQKINFDMATDFSLYLADQRFAGEYKVELIVQLNELNETICANILAEVYRDESYFIPKLY